PFARARGISVRQNDDLSTVGFFGAAAGDECHSSAFSQSFKKAFDVVARIFWQSCGIQFFDAGYLIAIEPLTGGKDAEHLRFVINIVAEPHGNAERSTFVSAKVYHERGQTADLG